MSGKLEYDIIKGYSANVKHEWARLSKVTGLMEYITTVHYLDRYMPKKGAVADIGSGPGRYSVLLASRGYNVIAVDPVEKNIEALAAKFRSKGVSKRLIGTHVGFAQNLSMLDDESFDVTVCLGGPMSHIMNPRQRKKAAEELIRITKSGGMIFASVMGRLTLFNGTVRAFNSDLDSDYIMNWAKSGDYGGGYGFLPFHGFRPDELEGLFGSSVKILAKTALEGFASYSGKSIAKLSKNKRRWDRWLKIHFSISEEPETIGVSEHYMLVMKKNGKSNPLMSQVIRVFCAMGELDLQWTDY
ncbi:Methyltransferase type 11 domain protein [mine drainage metagenome]|uniref:Methyltransferase type 11 domain protein n=1 Tax=mine drainage metagenome TaxID=410659 RepID=T0YNX2_9ZZZZ